MGIFAQNKNRPQGPVSSNLARVPMHLQTKLAINKPGDPYEQEADRVAARVVRMPEPRLRRACACGGECPRCQAEALAEGPARLQTQRVGSGDLGQTAVPLSVHEVLRSSGRSL